MTAIDRTTHTPPDRFGPADVRATVESSLTAYLAERTAATARISPEYGEATRELADFVLLGGKRVRPLFAYFGWRYAGGDNRDETVRTRSLRTFAALELVQACALIHDDIIDRSDTRRGRPTVHIRYTEQHRDGRLAGDDAHYGASTAILLGDLALAWADDMFAESPIDADALTRIRPIWSTMRTEVLGGQFLDIYAEASRDESLESAYRVMRYKTAGYTVSRPMQLGAALAGSDTVRLETIAAAGTDLGIAFQLRDDILGVFGDPELTGKPSGDDLMSGKRTALLAIALRRAEPAAAARLRDCIGRQLDDSDIDRAKSIIADCGALAEVENTISALMTSGLALLRDGSPEESVIADLTSFATSLANRES